MLLAMTAKVKALGLLSGGLDSILAMELIRRQGIEVVAFNVKTPFCIPKKDGTSEAPQAADQLKVPLKVLASTRIICGCFATQSTAMAKT